MVTSTISKLQCLSPQDGAHYFFGYYDIPAFSRNDQLHLTHRVQFDDRSPNEGDIAEVGYIERGKSNQQKYRYSQRHSRAANLITGSPILHSRS